MLNRKSIVILLSLGSTVPSLAGSNRTQSEPAGHHITVWDSNGSHVITRHGNNTYFVPPELDGNTYVPDDSDDQDDGVLQRDSRGFYHVVPRR
jgi:hypothetical protein